MYFMYLAITIPVFLGSTDIPEIMKSEVKRRPPLDHTGL